MAAEKVFVVFDEEARIKATAVPAHAHARIQPSKGLQVHAFDHPGLNRQKMSD